MRRHMQWERLSVQGRAGQWGSQELLCTPHLQSTEALLWLGRAKPLSSVNETLPLLSVLVIMDWNNKSIHKIAPSFHQGSIKTKSLCDICRQRSPRAHPSRLRIVVPFSRLTLGAPPGEQDWGAGIFQEPRSGWFLTLNSAPMSNKIHNVWITRWHAVTSGSRGLYRTSSPLMRHTV